MSEFSKSTTIKKYQTIKSKIFLIMFGEDLLDYKPEWKPTYKGDVGLYCRGYPHAVFKYENKKDVCENAQIAFEYLINKAKEFDFTRRSDFIAFETLFYNLITYAYTSERNHAQSENLLSIEYAKEQLEEKHFHYISLLYNIVQMQFWWWLNRRSAFNHNRFDRMEKFGVHFKVISQQIGSKEFWEKVLEFATMAHELYDYGELAKRFMFISDIQLLYVWNKYKSEKTRLVKYLDPENTGMFITRCFEDETYGWIKGLPYCDEWDEDDLRRGDYGYMNFSGIMASPVLNKVPIDVESLINDLKTISHYEELEEKERELEQANVALKEANKELERAQDEKKQVIAEFAHTYGNMQATTLQDIGTELLSVDDDLLHEWGRKIMVEYAIKQNLTKEVEMLKLQFEDQSSKLIEKLKNSLVVEGGKTVTNLVSDSLQRCFMSLLYGETRSEKVKRNMFFGTDEHADKRDELQEAFEQDVLVGEEDMLAWLKRKSILDISTEVSGPWKTLHFDDGGYAALLLTNWITELLTNAIKYADKTKAISLSFANENDMLTLSIRNYKNQATIDIHGTKQGISSIKASIRRLNHAVACENETETIEAEDDNALYMERFAVNVKVLLD